MRIIRTSVVVAVCLGFLSGVAFASFAYTASFHILGWRAAAVLAVVGGVIGAFVRRLRTIACIAGIAIAFGVLRFASVADTTGDPVPLREREDITVEGFITAVTSQREGMVMLLLTRTNVLAPHRGAPMVLHRPLLAFLSPGGHMDLMYGDTVRMRCRYVPPARARDRLATSGSCRAWSSQEVRILARDGGSPTLRALHLVRRSLHVAFNRVLLEPAAGLISGIMLGIPGALDGALLADFRRTGTVHILVISGWHMSFMGMQLRDWLLRRGLPRHPALLFALMGVAALTAMVGFTPAAVRGAVMVAVVIVVDLFGRLSNPIRVLLLTATVMVMVHPTILAFDLGFQLSFAATAGLLLGQPLLERALTRIGHAWARVITRGRAPGDASAFGAAFRRWTTELREIVAASLAASIATAPITIGAFGVVALLGPVVNIPVLLLVPPLMASGAALLIAVFLIPAIALPFAWVTTALATAIVGIVTRAAALPGVQLEAIRLDGWFVAGCSLLLMLAVLVAYRRRGMPILSPFAVLGKEIPDALR